MRYLLRPIRDSFNFTGISSRTEYFIFTLANVAVIFGMFLSTVIVFQIIPGMNMPFLNSFRPGAYIDSSMVSHLQFWFIVIVSFPMIALTVRRLRDSNANKLAHLWFFFPFLGPLVLFAMAFVPTFVDRIVTLPDGQQVWRSQQLSRNRRQAAIIGGALVVAGGAAAINGIQGSVGGLEVQGGKRITTPENARIINSDGRLNQNNTILGGNKAHMRNGKFVKASHNKYKL
jgi:uncharacterized membrane protein YhaH (DUF805 family)